MKAKGERQMRKLILVVLLLMAACCTAWADESGFCDPIPANYQNADPADYRDCIVFTTPEGIPHVYLLDLDGQSMEGFRLFDGDWQCTYSGDALDAEHTNVYFRRHQAGQLRPDGSAYPDDLGFDLYVPGGAYESYHYSGEYFTLCAFCDPDRYDGAVLIAEDTLFYYPAGSTEPEYTIFTGDDLLTLYIWTGDFDQFPATPAEARRLATLLPDAIGDDFEGYMLAQYQNDRDRAEAVFAQVADDGAGSVLRIIQAEYSVEEGLKSKSALLDIPISARMAAMPADVLWRDFYTLFREPDALDAARVPIDGRVVDLDPQREQLILLTEDAQGLRRVDMVCQDGRGRFFQQVSQPLPPEASLDDFHAGEGEILLYMDGQSWMVGYQKTSDARWVLGWVMGVDVDYTVAWGSVRCWSPEDMRLAGSLPREDLFHTDFSRIPITLETLRQALDTEHWAVVNNPNPQDRLNLRTKPSKSAESYGKFYNGTPVRVLQTSGDWCQVQIGENGLTGWMVRQYLAFGEAANSVPRAVADQTPLEIYEEQAMPGWKDRRKTMETVVPRGVEIIGVADSLYIVMEPTSGEIFYASMDDFWGGNG